MLRCAGISRWSPRAAAGTVAGAARAQLARRAVPTGARSLHASTMARYAPDPAKEQWTSNIEHPSDVPKTEAALEEARDHALVENQAPNHATTWSTHQRPRSEAMSGPRFEQTELELQPTPQAGIELIAQVPIQEVDARIVSCDGGRGPLGHPKVYINLDKLEPKACPYCGMYSARRDAR